MIYIEEMIVNEQNGNNHGASHGTNKNFIEYFWSIFWKITMKWDSDIIRWYIWIVEIFRSEMLFQSNQPNILKESETMSVQLFLADLKQKRNCFERSFEGFPFPLSDIWVNDNKKRLDKWKNSFH
jgi:hypothetical protein